MYSTIIAVLTFAVLGQAAQIKPLGGPTNIAAKFPVRDLNGGGGIPNATLGRGGLHANIVPQDFPAFLLLCETVSCISCFQFDMSAIPHNACLFSGLQQPIQSVAISQPSNSGLDFGAFVGQPACSSMAQIPTVNECFNVNGPPSTNYALA